MSFYGLQPTCFFTFTSCNVQHSRVNSFTLKRHRRKRIKIEILFHMSREVRSPFQGYKVPYGVRARSPGKLGRDDYLNFIEYKNEYFATFVSRQWSCDALLRVLGEDCNVSSVDWRCITHRVTGTTPRSGTEAEGQGQSTLYLQQTLPPPFVAVSFHQLLLCKRGIVSEYSFQC